MERFPRSRSDAHGSFGETTSSAPSPDHVTQTVRSVWDGRGPLALARNAISPAIAAGGRLRRDSSTQTRHDALVSLQVPHNRPGDLTGGAKFELFAEGEKNFFNKVTGSQIAFETGPEGRATSLIMRRASREPMPAPRLS